MNISKKYAPGLIFITVALTFGITAAFNYKFGTAQRPGAALFPIAVSVLLFLVGLASIATSATKELAYLDLKALAIIVAGLVSFAVCTAYINMAVGIAAMVYVTSFAIKEQTPKYQNLKIIAVLLIVAAAFKYALGMNLPLWK
jgi:hypothetical protein